MIKCLTALERGVIDSGSQFGRVSEPIAFGPLEKQQ